MNFFPSNLKILRKQNGLRQAEMPKHLGVTRTTWSNYETGISEPSIEGLLSIAKFFSVSVSELLEKPLTDVSSQKSDVSRQSLIKKSLSHRHNHESSAMWERTTTW